MGKKKSDAEKLAELLGLSEAPPSREEAHEISMEAEAALEYYENPKSFKEKTCKHCGRLFATRGAPVAYCSDNCRIKAFEERLGIRWSPLRSTEQRWGFLGEPLTVPPEALRMLQQVMVEQETDAAAPVDAESLSLKDEPSATTVPTPSLSDDVLDLLHDLCLD
jgi:hypothetical protein